VGSPIESLDHLEGHRWAIEECLETAKNEFGLDHDETRSWHGWHSHVSLVMLAFTILNGHSSTNKRMARSKDE
jgi:SRSO17 transposase